MGATTTLASFQSIQPRYPELKGQVAIVTGSSRRIGKGIAMRLAREGMKVVITSRTADTVQATTRELLDAGAEALAVVADLAQPDHVDRLFRETLAAFGTIHLLVNNAADLRRDRLFRVSADLLEHQIAANIRGPYLCSQRAAEIMRDHGHGGNLVHISTVGAARAHWQGLPYDMTKGAIDALTRALALDLAEYGIRVNCVAPGPIVGVRTPREGDKAGWEAIERVPLRCFGVPLDIGAAVAFLASPDAAFITGQILYVDGGLTAQLTPRHQPI